jgi:hypothetical protein
MTYHVSQKEYIFIADLLQKGLLNNQTFDGYIKEQAELLENSEKSLQIPIQDLHYQIDLIQKHSVSSDPTSPRHVIKTSPRLVSNVSPRNSSSELSTHDQDVVIQSKIDDIQKQLRIKMIEYEKTIGPFKEERELLLKIKQIIDEISTESPKSPRSLTDDDRWQIITALLQFREINKVVAENPLRLSGSRKTSELRLSGSRKISENPLRLSGSRTKTTDTTANDTNATGSAISSTDSPKIGKLTDSPSMERLKNLIKGLTK